MRHNSDNLVAPLGFISHQREDVIPQEPIRPQLHRRHRLRIRRRHSLRPTPKTLLPQRGQLNRLQRRPTPKLVLAHHPRRIGGTIEIRREHPCKADGTITEIPREALGLVLPVGCEVCAGVAGPSWVCIVSMGSGARSAHVQCSAHVVLAFCVPDEEELHFVLGVVEGMGDCWR